MSGDKPKPPKRVRPRWVRWTRRLFIFGLVVALLLGAPLAWVILSASGTRTALTAGLDWYDDAIPGGARVDAIEGSLSGTLVLRGVRISDRDGADLVTANRLELTPDWGALLTGTIGVTSLAIDGAAVTANGAWTDLAPVSDDEPEPEPEPETEGLGPNMPRIEVGELSIRESTVRLVSDGETSDLLQIASLRADAAGNGHDAAAELEATLTLPSLDLDLDRLSLRAGWQDPVARVPHLEIVGNFGDVNLDGAEFDASTFDHSLESLSARVGNGWLNRLVAALPDGSELELDASSVEGEILTDVGLRTDQGLAVTIGLETSLPTDGVAAAKADIQCTDCGIPGLTASASVDGSYDLETKEGDAKITLQSGETSAAATLHADAQQVLDAQTHWKSADLAGLNPILEAFAAPPILEGTTEGDVSCRIVPEPLDLQCQIEAGVQKFPPLDSAKIRADVAMAPPNVDVTLHELSTQLQGFFIEQTDGPARVAVAGSRVEVAGLAIRQRRRGGIARLDAIYDPQGSSHADVEVKRFDLSSIRPLLAGADIGGVISASVHGRYESGQVGGNASVSGSRLRVQGFELGTVKLASEVTPHRATANLRVRTPALGELAGDVEVPYRLDPDSGAPQLADGPIRGGLEVSDIRLRRVRPLVPGWAATGTVHAKLKIRGTTATPKMAAHVDVEDLEWDTLPLGTIRTESTYRRGTVTSHVDLEHPWIDGGASVEALAPVAVNLSAGRIRWKEHGRHQLRVDVGVVDLESAGAVAQLPLEGRASLGVELEGDPHAPVVTAKLSGQDIAFDDIPVGDVEFRADMQDDRTKVWIGLNSPVAGGLIVDARAPIDVDLVTGRPDWRKDEPHHLDLQAAGINLPEVAALVPDFDAEGTADLRVTLAGSATQPQIEVGLAGADLRVQDIPLEDFDLTGSYADDVAHVDATLRRANGTIHVLGMAPVHLDFGAPEAVWLEDARHELVAEIRGFDLEAIRPVFEIEDEDVGVSVDGDFRFAGSRRSFSVTSTARATMRAPGVPEHELAVRATAGPNKQEATLIIRDGDVVRGRARANLALDVNALADGKLDVKDVPLEVTLGLRDVDLQRLAGLFPVDLNKPVGKVKSDVEIKGTLGDPKVDGYLQLAKAGVTVVQARQRFEDLGLRLKFTNHRIELSQLKFRSGPGTMDIKGHVDIQDKHVRGKVFVETSKMPLRQPPIPTTRISTKIETTLDFGPKQSKVDVDVKSANLQVQSLTDSGAKAIPKNANVTFASEHRPTTTTSDEPEEDGEPPKPLNANLTFSSPIVVQGPLVNMEWKGGFKAGTVPDVAVDGSLKATPVTSTFNLLGNEFSIQRGEVAFAEGDLVPFINVDATVTVDGVNITASIRGRVTHPEIRMTSDPPYTEQEIFAILVTGTANNNGNDDGNVTAQAASALAAFSSPALQQSLGESLGVDRVAMSFGESVDEPIVSVGKQLRKKVYGEAKYHANAPVEVNRTELMLRYRFVPQWTYEVFYGDRAVGGMGVWWIRMFDTKLRNPPNAKKKTKSETPSKD